MGLGYVGLPLAVQSGKQYPTIGLDIDENRIGALKTGYDFTLEVSESELRSATHLSFTSNISDLADCNFYIVTVPTPIDHNKNPDLTPLINASSALASILKKGDIVVYESTVFPGCTEEICVPILENNSSLRYNEDFFCGYSPERINPGDKTRSIADILKVTSGSTAVTAKTIDQFYASLMNAGTYLAPSIKVAEAAKVIENAQRDINIAFVNELAQIFDKLDIDTHEVLKAAGTKWNFLNFKPGLVGGHCIGVDPYYLTQKAESVGHHPQVILAGRKINDGMGSYVTQRVMKLLAQKRQLNNDLKVLILGFTFKENCPDTRNTRVLDIYHEFCSFGIKPDIYDPVADTTQVEKEYGMSLTPSISKTYDAILLAVAHTAFNELNWHKLREETAIIFDVKSVLDRKWVDGRL